MDRHNAVLARDVLLWPIVPIQGRSARKTSALVLVSPLTRFVARDANATYRPSALITASRARLSASAPRLLTSTRVVAPVVRSLTNTSPTPLVSPGTRLDASDTKVT